MQHLGAAAGDFLRLVVVQLAQQARGRRGARVGAEHAGHVGPDLQPPRAELRGEIRAGGVRAAATQQHGVALAVAGDESLRDHDRRERGQARASAGSGVKSQVADSQLPRARMLPRSSALQARRARPTSARASPAAAGSAHRSRWPSARRVAMTRARVRSLISRSQAACPARCAAARRSSRRSCALRPMPSSVAECAVALSRWPPVRPRARRRARPRAGVPAGR